MILDDKKEKRDFLCLFTRSTPVLKKKVETAHLVLMRMTPAGRISPLTLRGYLLLMMMLVLYHVLGLAGLFGARIEELS